MGRGPGWSPEDWYLLQTLLEQGQSCPQIAEGQGWPLSSVKKAAARARKGQERSRYKGRTRQDPEDSLLQVAEEHPGLTAREVRALSGVELFLSATRKHLQRKFKSLRRQFVHGLTDRQKNLRKKWCVMMMRRILLGTGVRLRAVEKFRPFHAGALFFSDEK